MAGETVITFIGNVVNDPELRFTQSGAAVANFRMASTPRKFDKQTDKWVDGESTFLTINCWRQLGENVAESITKGMRVIVQGRLIQRSYETNGEKRTVFEIEADEIGPSLKNATARVNKATRDGSGNSGGARQSSASSGDDPWATAAPAAAGGFTNEPPF